MTSKLAPRSFLVKETHWVSTHFKIATQYRGYLVCSILLQLWDASKISLLYASISPTSFRSNIVRLAAWAARTTCFGGQKELLAPPGIEPGLVRPKRDVILSRPAPKSFCSPGMILFQTHCFGKPKTDKAMAVTECRLNVAGWALFLTSVSNPI